MHAHVYVDNFVIKGLRRDVHELFDELTTHMLVKNEGVLGLDPNQGDIFAQLSAWIVSSDCVSQPVTDKLSRFETDARHIDILVNQLNLVNAKTVVTPGIKNDHL